MLSRLSSLGRRVQSLRMMRSHQRKSRPGTGGWIGRSSKLLVRRAELAEPHSEAEAAVAQHVEEVECDSRRLWTRFIRSLHDNKL
jgi:hypothetical protein